MIPHEKAYSRYSDWIVWKYAKMVKIHARRNTTEPNITRMVGITVRPSPRDAARVQSISGLSHDGETGGSGGHNFCIVSKE